MFLRIGLSLSMLFATELFLCLRYKNHRNYMLMNLLDFSIFIKDVLNRVKIWYINYFDLKDNIELKYIKDGKELETNDKQDENILILRNLNNIKNESDETYNNYTLIYNNETFEDIKNEELIENIEDYKCDYSLLVMSVILDNNDKHILDFKTPCDYLMKNNIINANFLNYYLNLTHNVNLTEKYTVNIMTNKMDTFKYDETEYVVLEKDKVCLNKY